MNVAGVRRWEIEDGRPEPLKFEDLDAWQAARRLVQDVYRLTKQQRLGKDFGLCSQLQRSAVSMMTNIAEGFERGHVKEKIQFYNVARASAGELRSLLYVVGDCYPDLDENARAAREECVRLGKLISGLLRSTRARQS